jgi:hypothetical protein
MFGNLLADTHIIQTSFSSCLVQSTKKDAYNVAAVKKNSAIIVLD